jgi:pilus assembly protein CpaB
VISPDKRAIAVKVDKVIGVSGFIHPNNRVDVLVTLKRVGGAIYNPITKIILENILVLAVGPDIEEKKGKEEKATPVDVITLEVTPEEAEKIALAAQEGKISLALRKHGDANEVLTTGQTAMGLINSYSKSSRANLR